MIFRFYAIYEVKVIKLRILSFPPLKPVVKISVLFSYIWLQNNVSYPSLYIQIGSPVCDLI